MFGINLILIFDEERLEVISGSKQMDGWIWSQI